MKKLIDVDQEVLNIFEKFKPNEIQLRVAKPGSSEIRREFFKKDNKTLYHPIFIARTGISFSFVTYSIILVANSIEKFNKIIEDLRVFSGENSLQVSQNEIENIKIIENLEKPFLSSPVFSCELLFSKKWE